MKKILLITAVCLVIWPGAARADEFSLYGVTMGMTQTEIETRWKKPDGDRYVIEESLISNIVPEFDHRGRMYKVSFTAPIPMMDQYPGTYATSAFQEVVQQRWSHPDLIVSLRTGRGMADITITSRSLERELSEHVKIQMQTHLTTVLKP